MSYDDIEWGAYTELEISAGVAGAGRRQKPGIR